MHMPFVHHEEESSGELRVAALIDHVGDVKGLMGLDVCCLGRPYDRYYLI